MNIDLITLGVFSLIAILFFALYRLFSRRRANELEQRSLAFGPLTHVLALLIPIFFESKEALKKDLMRAGHYHRYALREYLAIRNALIIGWVALTAIVYFTVTARNPSFRLPILAMGIVIAILFYSIPRLLLHAQASSRLRRIQFALPDALDMITMSMTGGLPLVQSLEHVSREITSTHPDLGCELLIVRRQMEAGSFDQALRHFAERIDIPDVQSLAALIGHTERLGANVAAAFHDYAESVRRSLRQSAEERGNKASVKLLLPIVFCLAPPVYILLLAPALLELRTFVIEQNRPGGVLVQEVEVPDATPVRRTSPTTEAEATRPEDNS
jgi:tight adherence protein C